MQRLGGRRSSGGNSLARGGHFFANVCPKLRLVSPTTLRRLQRLHRSSKGSPSHDRRGSREMSCRVCFPAKGLNLFPQIVTLRATRVRKEATLWAENLFACGVEKKIGSSLQWKTHAHPHGTCERTATLSFVASFIDVVSRRDRGVCFFWNRGSSSLVESTRRAFVTLSRKDKGQRIKGNAGERKRKRGRKTGSVERGRERYTNNRGAETEMRDLRRRRPWGWSRLLGEASRTWAC
ncbi:putative ADP-ribosylation factor family protein 2 [Toxoplasma gondii ARI]|uniref:Putative ADP-ribosylation factor family protein 2 n=1 Tax=Toxoplasma gondii ARI TaxID=1074872 RepID=A0A139XXX4_TOXGO|nr:putative ADP-ribosylation factor family protein 2 [Toxoplasma gondii ARI]